MIHALTRSSGRSGKRVFLARLHLVLTTKLPENSPAEFARVVPAVSKQEDPVYTGIIPFLLP
ncbi:MAG: hypothetical protein DWI02_06865, partial [Planctomycetota bacterium]